MRDVGVNEREQVSLSNTYSLNRGITQEQAAAILRTYQRIRGSLPPGSPGEWYAIYPPFAKGFGDHSEPWQYVNGGVSPIFAGELARGAFVHGFESYGADVLSRVLDLVEVERRPDLVRVHRGLPAGPGTALHARRPLDAREHGPRRPGRARRAAVDGRRAGRPPRPPADRPTGRSPACRSSSPTRRRTAGVGRSRSRAGPGSRSAWRCRSRAKAGSIYVLHSVGNAGNQKVAGAITFVYEDGTEATQYAVQDRNVSGWWYPVARGLLARGLRRAPPPSAREARLAREKRRLPERRDLLVRPRQPAPRSGRSGPSPSQPRSTEPSTRWPA